MPQMKTITVFSFLFLSFIISSADARELFVAPSGNDGTQCTQSSPCRQIRRALELVQPGDTILAADGQYLGFTASNINGTAEQPITIRAQSSGVEIIPTTDRGTYGDRDNIYITFCQYLIIDGLRTFNAPRAGMRVDASHNITVKNGVFGNNYKWGIFTNHANNLVLEYNETYGSQDEHGIYFSNSGDNPTIRGNISHDNNANGIHMNGDLSAGSHGGVVGDGIISGALVENNIIYNNGSGGGAGINMDGVQDSTIRNNVLYNNSASGITAYRIDGGAGPKNLEIYHNTIDMASRSRYAIQVSQTTGQITIRNNILYARDSRRGGLAYGTDADVPNVDSDYNIFGGTAVIALNDWTVRHTLAEWQQDGHESNSFTATLDALFRNSSQQDYHLKDTSPAIDKGQTLSSVTKDRDGNSRPAGSSSDNGAYEFGVTDTVAPAAPDDLRKKN